MANFFPREYPVMEVGISCVNSKDHRIDCMRRKRGDIIAIRKPHHCIGTKEAKDYLWLRIEGLEKGAMQALGQKEDDLEVPFKRQYFIPMHRLKKVYPALDLNRVYDRDDEYQPFCTLDENYRYVTTNKPFQAKGLVQNILTRKYL